MPTIRMTIKYVNEPKPGKSRGSIKGTDDNFLGVPQALLRLFEVGKTFDVQYTENGEWKTVTSATEVQVETKPAATASPAASNGPSYRQATPPADSKQMFICANLTAMIRAGKVENTKESIWFTTQLFAQTWDHMFGERGVFQASEPARLPARA